MSQISSIWLSRTHFPDGGGEVSGDGGGGGGGPQEAAWSPDSEEAPEQGRRNPPDPQQYIYLLNSKSKFNTNQQCCCCCCCCFHCYRNGWGGASSEVGWGPKGWKDRVRENQQRRKGIWGQKCRQYQSHRNRVAQIFPRGMFSILRWQLDNIWSNYGGSNSSVHWRKLSLSLLQRSCLGGKYGKSAWVKVVGSVGRSAACRLKTTSENTFTVTPIQRGFTQPLLRFLLSVCLYLFCSR